MVISAFFAMGSPPFYGVSELYKLSQSNNYVNMEKIGNLINSAFAKRGVLGRQVQASMVVEFCNGKIKEYWGKNGRELAKAIHLKKNILTISAANSLIAQELKFKQYKMIEEINEKFGKDIAKKIVIIQKGLEKQEKVI